MNADPHATVVSEPAQQPAPVRPAACSDLARLAFGSARSGALGMQSVAPRHLAFLPPEALELDLDDPNQCRFGDYELVEKLGQGGMGVVYRARQLSLDRDVAVKLLSAGPWASRDFIERFKREAQSAARMQHPNIVAIFEIGSEDELNFFSMRLVRGNSLAQVLAEQGPMAPRQAAALVRTIAEALDYAHRLGVLHLDLKPGNVLIDERGEPQVADFGLARRMDESLAADNDEVSGTPSYMAPEQAQLNVHKLSPATDIYGLGAILYELLTGKPPFLGPTPQETLLRVVRDEALPIRELDPALPRDLEAVCRKCLAKAAGARYGSARELATDLTSFLDGRPVGARPLNRPQKLGRWIRREPRLAALAALLLVSLGTGLGATSLQWQRAQANAAASNERLWEGRRETALRLQQAGNGFEAAARLLLNVGEREHAAGAAARVERSHLGVLLGQGVSLIDSMLLIDANPLATEISPDGRLLAVALNDSTVRWFDTRTLTEQGRVDLLDQPASEGYAKIPALLRFVDGKRLRVTLEWGSNQISPNDGDSFLIDLERGRVVEPPEEFADFADAAYSADGGYALLRNHRAELQLWRVDPWQPLSALAPAGGAKGGHASDSADGAISRHPVILGRNARFAAYTVHASKKFELYDPSDATKVLPVELPAHAGISAWAESGDGAWLALGDNEGRVFLVDLATHAVRVLPTPRGQDISWVAFSEDDAWLSACGLDGALYAFEVASGNPLVPTQMRQGFELRRVALSRSQRLLVATGVGQTALWRLPDPSPHAMEAGRLSTTPTRDALAGQFAIGWSLATGLLATAGVEGQVRLWRLPTAARRDAQASRLLSGSLRFDGKRIVDVAYDQVRIVAPDGNALTRWLALPRAPGYAELVGAGDTLVVTVANELRVYDSSTLRPRFAPIVLPATPQNLVASADGSIAALTFGGHGAEGFEERVEVYDLKLGKRRAAAPAVKGPLRQLALSEDSSRLIVTGPRNGSTAVYETASLQQLGEYRHDPAAPVIWAAFGRDASTVLLVLRVDDPRQQDDALLSWDFAAGQVRTRHPLSQLRPVAVANANDGVFVSGSNYDLFDPGGPRELVPERLTQGPATVAFAVSPDGRLIAHGFRNEVQLYDGATLAPIGAPLYADAAAGDALARLAFAPDSASLLGRGIQGSWYVWPVAGDSRTEAEIGQDLALLRDAHDHGAPRRVLAPAERQRLRRGDPGPWRAAEVRPAAAAARVVNGAPVPARSPDLDPLMLDLTQAYNIAPDAYLADTNNMIATQRYLGTGLQRIDGVDYDIRGSTQLFAAPSSDAASAYTANKAVGIPVPPVPVAGFHVLLFAGHTTAEPEERVYAQLRLHYVDRSTAVVPLRTRREVPGWTENDGPVPFGWAYGDYLRATGAPEQILISNPRVANPHPDRLVATLDLEAGTGTWNMPVFLAVTAEPVSSADGSRNESTSPNPR